MYELSRCEDDGFWDSLLASSSEATPYCYSSYLNSTKQRDFRFVLSYKRKPVVLSVLTPGKEGENRREFSDYQGLMFLGPKATSYSDDLLRLSHIKALLDYSMIDQNEVIFSLNPEISDIRAFQWFTFDNSEDFEMLLNVRYTGIVELQSFRGFDDYLGHINVNRSREFLANLDAITESDGELGDVQSFLELYTYTFDTQGIKLKQDTLEKVESIIEGAIEGNYGELRIARTLSGEPIAGAFFLKNSNARLYQFGASSSLKSSYPGNSHLILKSIQESFLEGHSYFDISGLNSPNRGFFKASFASRPKPFYEIVLKRIRRKTKSSE